MIMKCNPILSSKIIAGRETAIAASLLAVLALAASAARAQSTCTYTKFTINGNITGANSVNKYGTVVGSYNSNPANSNANAGFIRTASGAIHTFLVPGSSSTIIRRRNDQGVDVGVYTNKTGGHGFVQSGSTVETVNFPGAISTDLWGINDFGAIVGVHDNGKGFKLQNGKFTSIHFPNSVITIPKAINNSGVIVGAYELTNGGPFHSFVLANGTYKEVGFTANDINDNGEIVGGNKIFKNGAVTSLAVPNAQEFTANGVSDTGEIVGSFNNSGKVGAFIRICH
jgi:hypothetical protein